MKGQRTEAPEACLMPESLALQANPHQLQRRDMGLAAMRLPAGPSSQMA